MFISLSSLDLILYLTLAAVVNDCMIAINIYIKLYCLEYISQ